MRVELLYFDDCPNWQIADVRRSCRLEVGQLRCEEHGSPDGSIRDPPGDGAREFRTPAAAFPLS
jgi:hypothetical protein